VTSSELHEGLCHCRAIGFRYRTALSPKNWVIRACQCSFCRTHAALSTSDPTGSLEFVEHAASSLQRYEFGLRTADFLLCRNCGAYIGARMRSERRHVGIINVRVLHPLVEQLPEAVPMDYETETVAERLARRKKGWTPIAIG
jgi:hypothetical protein